jgi:outer membrane lipoprotein
MTKKLTLSVLLLALAGCSSTAPDSIQAKASTNLIGFEQVVQTNDVHISGKAQWGGMIVDVVQLENRTVLEVANLALSSNARPMTKKSLTGHFKIYIDEKVNPKTY